MGTLRKKRAHIELPFHPWTILFAQGIGFGLALILSVL